MNRVEELAAALEAINEQYAAGLLVWREQYDAAKPLQAEYRALTGATYVTRFQVIEPIGMIVNHNRARMHGR